MTRPSKRPPGPRPKYLAVAVSHEEAAVLRQQATQAGLSRHAWIRVLLGLETYPNGGPRKHSGRPRKDGERARAPLLPFIAT